MRILALATPSFEATPSDADFGRWPEIGGATVALADVFSVLVVSVYGIAGRPLLFLREAALLARSGSFRLHAASWSAAMGLLSAARSSCMAAWLVQLTRRVRHAWRT